MTIREAVAQATLYIPRRDAELLLAHAAGRNRAWLLAHPEAALDTPIAAQFHALVHRRDAGEPLQHLTGTQEFFGLPLHVTRDVLIPRPETEHLVEAVLTWARKESGQRLRIADVGTGSGAIVLALAANLATADLVALDISPAALSVARDNAERTGLSRRIRFSQSDLLAAVGDEAPFDAIVSNPPYVADGDAATLAPEVRDHEPALALYAGPDGLAVYRGLLPQARTRLRPGGLLALEFGFGQRDGLADLLRDWKDLRFIDDYAGIPRVALALRP